VARAHACMLPFVCELVQACLRHHGSGVWDACKQHECADE
jgi:hypothetical protein